jgi:hypothetical protein
MFFAQAEIPTHTTHITPIPSDMALQQALFAAHGHICITQNLWPMAASGTGAMSSVCKYKIRGNFWSQTLMGGK